jgi:DNA-binding HxlR family transcriptional regulator
MKDVASVFMPHRYAEGGAMNKNAPAGNRPRLARPDPLTDCPLNAAFVAVGGKWKLTILYWLGREPHQFRQHQRRAAPVSHKVLVEQLRELEAHGLVRREVSGAVPSPVRYMLTEYGDTLRPLIETVRIWGERHLARSRARPAEETPLMCVAPLESCVKR